MSGIPIWAVKGARVICVDDRWNWHGRPSFAQWVKSLFNGDPKKRDICRIEGVEVCRLGKVWLYLSGYGETPYTVTGFRPIVTHRADLKAHFEALLHVRNPQLEAAE